MMEKDDSMLNTNNDFKEYYVKNITPVMEHRRIIKSKYKQKFWVFFWSALAVNCINILFILFNILIRDKSFDITDITTLLFFSVLFVLFPFYLYKVEEKPSYINAFFSFFGNIQSDSIKKNYTSDSIFIPVGDSLVVNNQVDGELFNYRFHMADIQSKVKLPKVNIEKVVSEGIHISMVLTTKIEHIVLWDKKSFNKSSNVKGLSEIKDTNIPIAGYFRIFSDNPSTSNNLISVSFFEALLDIKDIFSATSINVEIENDNVDIYLENAEFPLFVRDNLMKSCLQEDDFQKAYDIIEKIVFWNETMEALYLR